MTRVFPHPGAGEDEERPVAVEHGLALGVVQAVEEIGHAGGDG